MDFFVLNKAYESQNVWTFTLFFFHMMGFNECESTKSADDFGCVWGPQKVLLAKTFEFRFTFE